jgi:outer membrane receptor protein involved in Fe transport
LTGRAIAAMIWRQRFDVRLGMKKGQMTSRRHQRWQPQPPLVPESLPRRSRCGVGIAIAAILYGTGETRAASSDEPLNVLTEIVVTARKRAENVQDVPQNIDVYTARDLENLDIRQLEDYLARSPSISYISTGPGQQRFFMRGASDGSNPNFGRSNLSTTGYLLDDLPFNFYGRVPDLHLYDVERIEVLNGPQGTLFGAGSLSGAVRVITKKPDPNAFSAGVDFDGGRIDGGSINSSYEGFVNMPLVDGKTALRLSAYSVRDGGYINNLLSTRNWLNGTMSTNAEWAGNNYNTRNIVGGRVALQEDFSDDWNATLTAYYQRQRYQGSWEEDLERAGVRNLKRFSPQGGYNYDGYLDLHVEGDVGIGDLVYAGGLKRRRTARLYDYSEYAQYSNAAGFAQASACATDPSNGSGYSGCNVPYMYASPYGQIDQLSNELRLQSKPGGRAHWTVGAFWEKTQDPYVGFIAMPGINVQGQQAQAVISYYQNPSTPTTPLPQEYYSDYATFDYLETTEFGDLTFDVNDRWSVEAGVDHFHSFSSELSDWFGYYAQPKIPSYRKNSSAKTNFKAGVNFKAASNVLLYFSWAQGFRDGGFNYVSDALASRFPQYFKPDTLNNYEFGWKTDWGHGRIVWNGAVYYMNWKDYQISVSVAGPPFGFNTNVGDVRIAGVESGIELHPVAGLQLSLNANYNDSRLRSNEFENPVFPVMPGERVPEAPSLNMNAVARYEFPVFAAAGSFASRAFVQFDAAHKGAMWNDLRIDTRTLQPAYTIGNLRFGLSEPKGRWRAEAYVSNLWNTRAVVFANYSSYSHPQIPTQPRVFGLRLSYRIGKTD